MPGTLTRSVSLLAFAPLILFAAMCPADVPRPPTGLEMAFLTPTGSPAAVASLGRGFASPRPTPALPVARQTVPLQLDPPATLAEALDNEQARTRAEIRDKVEALKKWAESHRGKVAR